MQCPICDKTMTAGVAFLEKTWMDAFRFGLGSRDLFFRDEAGVKTKEMGAWDTHQACKCTGCGCLLLAGKDPSRTGDAHPESSNVRTGCS